MTDSPLIHFIDGLVINQPAKATILEDAKAMLDRDSGTVLSIQIDATHSGLLTNGRVYPGIHVRRGYKTYFSKDKGGAAEFDKPILKNHNDHEDPIGRIVGGQFIRFKSGDAFKKDFLNPDVPGQGSGKGSGVVRIQANIMDADSIAKILDGRLLTVSSGHHTDSLSCSLCGNQLFYGYDGNTCDHIPGKFYDDDDFKGLCYGITGKLVYDEVSTVARPAQGPAMITKTDWEATKQQDCLQDGGIVIDASERGKKTHIPAMALHDDSQVIDLIAAKIKDKTNKVLVSFARDDVISSVLGDLSSENDLDSDITESESVDTTQDSSEDAYETSRFVSGLNATSVSSKDLGDVGKNHHESNQAGKGSETVTNFSLGDGDKNSMTTNKNDNSVESTLQMENAQLQLEVKEKGQEIENLKGQLDKKDAEITRLTDDAAKMQNDLARDYATLVAKYRTLLDKPGCKFDSVDEYNTHIDELSKRTVESLRDTLEDLKLEYADFEKKDSLEDTKETKDDTKMLDTSNTDKLTTPAAASDKNDTSENTVVDALDAAKTLFN